MSGSSGIIMKRPRPGPKPIVVAPKPCNSLIIQEPRKPLAPVTKTRLSRQKSFESKAEALDIVSNLRPQLAKVSRATELNCRLTSVQFPGGLYRYPSI